MVASDVLEREQKNPSEDHADDGRENHEDQGQRADVRAPGEEYHRQQYTPKRRHETSEKEEGDPSRSGCRCSYHDGEMGGCSELGGKPLYTAPDFTMPDPTGSARRAGGLGKPMDRILRQLARTDASVGALLQRVPQQQNPPLRPDWLRIEMLERFQLLEMASVSPGTSLLDVGAGPHAITTVPLAHLVGPNGSVVAAERERWTHFRNIAEASGLAHRIRPVTCDARRLPLRSETFRTAFCVHGVRSLGTDDEITRVLREMLRVAGRVFIAESLPEARTQAQRAHLAMYNLRAEVFEATTGRADDRPYRPLDELRALVEAAGGSVEQSRVLDMDLPHALAYFPRSRVEEVPGTERRRRLLALWDEARQLAETHGTDHPPVGVVVARH